MKVVIMMCMMMEVRLMMMELRLMMTEVAETGLQPTLPRLMGSNGLSDWIINPILGATIHNPLNTTNNNNNILRTTTTDHSIFGLTCTY